LNARIDQLSPVDGEGIARQYGKIGQAVVAVQLGDQPGISLDRADITSPLGKRSRKDSSAGAYFDDRITALGPNPLNDASNHPPVREEVLAEAFLCPHQCLQIDYRRTGYLEISTNPSDS